MIGNKGRFAGLAAGIALLLAACGGDGAGGEGGTGVNPGPGDPGSPPPRLEGAWSGGFEVGADPGDARLLVLAGGEYWFLYGSDLPGGFEVEGFVQGSGVSASGQFSSVNAKDFLGLLPAPTGTLDASFTADAAVGAARFPDWTFEFAVEPMPASIYDYAAPAAMDDIVGSWPMRLLDGTPVEVTIQPDGSLAGEEDTVPVGGPRCGFVGTATPRPGGTNVFDVQIQFGPAPCTLPNQVVTGVGFTHAIAGTAVRQFLVAGVNGIRGRGTVLYGTR